MRRWRGLFVELGVVGALAVVVGYYAVQPHAPRLAQSEPVVAAHADEVFRSPRSVVAGNPDGDVSVVAFLDYNCPDCRKDAPTLSALVAKDGDLRLVLKVLPLLGPDSEDAARVVLAAKRQGDPYALHQRLMSTQARVTKARALAIAGALGLETEQLARDMGDPAFTAALLANRRLADDLGVRGVPFYLVGDRVVPSGGTDLYGVLERHVAAVREDGCTAVC